MGHRDIILKGKKVGPHKAFMSPDFDGATILVDDQFDFVELWLKRNSCHDSVLFWQQARNFHNACLNLPKESRAVTSYYCMLNAAKALLTAKKIDVVEKHGIYGESMNSRTSLANEKSTIQSAGILPALASYFGATGLGGKTISLKDILYNIPFVHRAYTVTFRGAANLFVPIVDGHFAIQNGGYESWFCATIQDPRYQKDAFIEKQRGWERDKSETNSFVIRSKHRFDWNARGVKKKERIKLLTKNHQSVRRDIKYIHGPSRLWYFKRNDKEQNILPWPTPALIFIAMHRLSEMTRYDPQRLSKHFTCQHNWLLSEFISLANENFIDQIASDITGREMMVPGYRK